MNINEGASLGQNQSAVSPHQQHQDDVQDRDQQHDVQRQGQQQLQPHQDLQQHPRPDPGDEQPVVEKHGEKRERKLGSLQLEQLGLGGGDCGEGQATAFQLGGVRTNQESGG